MPEHGFMTRAETRAEWEAAEKALLAGRDKEQLAGEPTAKEAEQLAAAAAVLERAAAATGAAFRAVVTARDAVREPWQGATAKEGERITEAERALTRASRDEEDAREAQARLIVAISAAGRVRREAVG